MRRDLLYFLALGLLALVALPADVAAVQALPLGPDMQLLLATGIAGLTAFAAHVGAIALADTVEHWTVRHRAPWKFWLNAGQAVAVIGGTLLMLLWFALLRGDVFGVIAQLTSNEELGAAGWKINLALLGLQVVCFVVALTLGVKRWQERERRELQRDIARLDRQIRTEQARAGEAERTVAKAEHTLAGLDREEQRQRERIQAWAVERHKRCDYQWHKQRIKARVGRTAWRCARDRSSPPVRGAAVGDVLDAINAQAAGSDRTNGGQR